MSLGWDPGELRELATIEELAAPVRDAGGGRSNSAAWSALATDPTWWVNVRPLSASQRRFAAQQGAPVTHEITGRYRTDVDSLNRLVIGSRTFDLVSAGVNPDERGEFLRFEAREDGD